MVGKIGVKIGINGGMVGKIGVKMVIIVKMGKRIGVNGYLFYAIMHLCAGECHVRGQVGHVLDALHVVVEEEGRPGDQEHASNHQAGDDGSEIRSKN